MKNQTLILKECSFGIGVMTHDAKWEWDSNSQKVLLDVLGVKNMKKQNNHSLNLKKGFLRLKQGRTTQIRRKSTYFQNTVHQIDEIPWLSKEKKRNKNGLWPQPREMRYWPSFQPWNYDTVSLSNFISVGVKVKILRKMNFAEFHQWSSVPKILYIVTCIEMWCN